MPKSVCAWNILPELNVCKLNATSNIVRTVRWLWRLSCRKSQLYTPCVETPYSPKYGAPSELWNCWDHLLDWTWCVCGQKNMLDRTVSTVARKPSIPLLSAYSMAGAMTNKKPQPSSSSLRECIYNSHWTHGKLLCFELRNCSPIRRRALKPSSEHRSWPSDTLISNEVAWNPAACQTVRTRPLAPNTSMQSKTRSTTSFVSYIHWNNSGW